MMGFSVFFDTGPPKNSDSEVGPCAMHFFDCRLFVQ